jgi:hypothetical protein
MKILDIYPKDIYVVCEFSSKDIEKLHKALGLTKINYDGKDKEEAEAVRYLTEAFFPAINEIMRKLKNES